jgi:hypothetical protein
MSFSFVGSKWTGLSAAKLRFWRGFKESIMEGTDMRSKKYFNRGIVDSLFLMFWIADEPLGPPLMLHWMAFSKLISWISCISNAKA